MEANEAFFPVKLKLDNLTPEILTLRNTERSSLSWKELMPDGIMDPYKGVNRTGNSKYGSKHKTLLLLFANVFTNKWSFKEKI